ncbi:MAG TPA: hypothetical protein ENI51_09670 [Candidatus Atribacteria bacterium]|nr:hypothetical protein [Candidatus Atribacteria bacterium]
MDWISIIRAIISVVGAIGAILAAIFAFRYGKKSIELVKEQLKIIKREKPAEGEGEIEKLGFLIPDRVRHKVSYAKQDNREHLVKDLILPPNKEVTIMLWIKPKSNYTVEDNYFGCEGDYDKKPEPIAYFNPFVLRGKIKEITPEENEHHYIDHHKYYHVKSKQEFTRDEVYVKGYKIQTHDEGGYIAKYIIRTPNRVKEHKLKIKVSGKKGEKMKCLIHNNCYIDLI